MGSKIHVCNKHPCRKKNCRVASSREVLKHDAEFGICMAALWGAWVVKWCKLVSFCAMELVLSSFESAHRAEFNGPIKTNRPKKFFSADQKNGFWEV